MIFWCKNVTNRHDPFGAERKFFGAEQYFHRVSSARLFSHQAVTIQDLPSAITRKVGQLRKSWTEKTRNYVSIFNIFKKNPQKQVAVSYLLGTCQVSVRQLLGSCQVAVRQLLASSQQAVSKHLASSQQAVSKHFSTFSTTTFGHIDRSVICR